MNEIAILAISACFTALGALLCGIVLHVLRGWRDRITQLDAKINQSREAIARLEGSRGILGTRQDWRE